MSKWILLIFSSFKTELKNKYRALFNKSEAQTNKNVSHRQM